MKQRPEDRAGVPAEGAAEGVGNDAAAGVAADTADAAERAGDLAQDPTAQPTRGGSDGLDAYRRLLSRYRDTLDLMSPQGMADLDTKLAEAERYAVALADHMVGPGSVLDLGSGAGLPGVVVASRLPDHEHLWVERRRKRAAFLTQVAAQAGLSRVRVVVADVRSMDRADTGPVHAVTAQAVASLAQVARLTAHLWADDGVILVSRKGPDWAEEVEALVKAYEGSAGVQVLRAEPLGTRGTLVAVRVMSVQA